MASSNPANWVEKRRKASAVVADYILTSQPDDSFGWGSRVSMLAKTLHDGQTSGLLITGPDGCGKHTCAAHMVNALRNDGYGTVFISGEDAAACCKMGFSISSGIDALLDDAYDRKEGICMVFERLEKFEGREELYNYLSNAVCEYHMNSDALLPLFVILIEKEPASVPALLRSRLLHCNMIVPTRSCREAFLKNNAQGIRSCVDLNGLAASTEGFTYSQLVNLVKNITLELDAKDLTALSGDDLNELIKLHAQSCYESGDKLTLLKKAEALIDMLPPLIGQIGKQGLQLRSDAPHGAQYDAQPSQSGLSVGNINIEAARNKLEAMPLQKVFNDFISAAPVNMNELVTQ